MIPPGSIIEFKILDKSRECRISATNELGAFVEYVLIFSTGHSKAMREFFSWRELMGDETQAGCKVKRMGGLCE